MLICLSYAIYGLIMLLFPVNRRIIGENLRIFRGGFPLNEEFN